MKQFIRLEVLGANVTKLWLGDRVILFSYNTPVACWLLTGEGQREYALRDRLSITTRRHLTVYGPARAEAVSAAELAAVITG